MKKIIFILFILCGIFFYKFKLNEYVVNGKDFNNISKLNELKYENINDDNKIDINNLEKIHLGSDVRDLINNLGNPARIDKSEYSFDWYVYNQYGKDFAMVGIKDDKVVGIYSNSINSSEIENIKLDQNKNYIRQEYKPLEYKKKGNTKYVINSYDQYDTFYINEKYITVFYDIYNDNKITSYQVISKEAEESLNGIYPRENEDIKKAFELQTIDLVNSTRLKYGLNKLEYSEKATKSARSHSEDMMKENYFDHTNKNNESPFDRMKKENINYSGAGENIAAGQTSAIFAHEAWMNSQGHRKNILGDYKYIGVGVSFGGYYSIYYTQNFYI